MVTLRLVAFLLLVDCCVSLQAATSRRNAVAAYVSHWENLLLTEYQEAAAELRQRRKTWSRQRLQDSGMSVVGATAEPESELFGEKIVRVIKRGETRFRDRFTRGDVLVMTPQATSSVDPIPRECLVVNVGKDWLSIGVGSSWPVGLWEARKLSGFYRVRLDRTAPQAPLRAQRRALDRMRRGESGKAATLMAALFQNDTDSVTRTSELPSRFEPVLGLEEDLWKALNEAKNATSFVPNQSQENSIIWALQRCISLIRGPPGTGKTRVAALLVSTALRLQSDTQSTPRVLAVTHSNGAADVLLEALLQMGVPAVRVGRPACVSPSLQHRTVIALSEKMPQVVRLRRKASDMELDPHIRSAAAFELRQCMMDAQNVILKTAPVVVTSCIGAHQLLEDDGADMTFPMVVLDEAAQTTEPALICALAASKAEQVVLVGDTRQLPPTVTSMDLRDSLGVSPMARLEKAGVGQITLRVQYRMPPGLLQHPSNYFYNGLVICAETKATEKRNPPAGFPWASLLPLAFVQIGNGDSEAQHSFGGRSNPIEAQLVATIVSNLLAAGDVDDRNIAVISPYSKQVQLIRTELASQRNTQNVRVGTVDSFQGQETDVVVFSAVRSNPMNELGFLRDSRRLCVAITRARRGLILVGDKRTLKSCHHWAALIDSCDKRKCFVEIHNAEQSNPALPPVLPVEARSTVEDAIADLFDEAEDVFGLFSTATSNFEGL